jgi:hypothetical protein
MVKSISMGRVGKTVKGRNNNPHAGQLTSSMVLDIKRFRFLASIYFMGQGLRDNHWCKR